ncbi:MAG: CidA/LrgA family protein [Polaromonas sp.]
MMTLRGLAWLLVFQSVGELLARALSLPFPGPVVGMVLLLAGLRWQSVREPVSSCADFLLSHLSLLFVPVGVGVMTHLSLVSEYGFRMLAVVALSTLAGLAVTVLSLHLLRDRGVTQASSTDSKEKSDA